MERPHPDPKKLLLTQQIEQQLAEYIARGGVITVVPYGYSAQDKDGKSHFKAGPP